MAEQQLHAVIMAGGAGTRFWPLSRDALPKQFLSLSGEQSLLRETYARLTPIVGDECVWVVSNRAHVDLVRHELPEIPTEQVLGEPVGRNTAPCIGLAAQRIHGVDPGAALLVCPADHVIRPHDDFQATVTAAHNLLSKLEAGGTPWTITLGVSPVHAATGFGYMERGEALEGGGDTAKAFRVERFKEKPTAALAEEYIASGRYYWNSGIFLWRAAGVLSLLESYLPGLAGGLREIEASVDAGAALASALEEGFPRLPSISIDYGVLEKTSHVAVVEAGFAWDDVGSFSAVERYAPRQESNSVLGTHVGVRTKECIVVGEGRLIGTVGVENLVVVATDDAVLVCDRRETEAVKELVELLKEKGHEDVL